MDALQTAPLAAADIRKIVIDALQLATGFLDDADTMKAILSRQDLRFEDLDLDSLSRFEVIMEIEDKLSIELDDDEVVQFATLHQLIRYLETRI